MLGNADVTLAAIHPASEKLAPVRESLETGRPVEWLRVHELPDFVYFNHSAHVNRGVSCVSCHDRIDKMEVVYQAKPLSMKWCLDCHRNPEENLRPVDQVTNLGWAAFTDAEIEEKSKESDFDPDTAVKISDVYAKSAADGFSRLVKNLDVAFDRKVKGKTEKIEKNGKLDLEEVAHIFAKPKRVDDNRDGNITVDELQTFGEKATRKDLGTLLRAIKNINPSTSCSTCHR